MSKPSTIKKGGILTAISALALCSSSAFGWSITGVVKTNASATQPAANPFQGMDFGGFQGMNFGAFQGMDFGAFQGTPGTTGTNDGTPLAGVAISTFNYAGFSTTSAADGTFSLTNETSSIRGIAASSTPVFLHDNTLTINNLNAQTVKVSAISALGKITYQRTLHNTFGSATFDLGKSEGKNVKFIRVSVDNKSMNYIVGGRGLLLKEDDVLPVFSFTKEGYKNTIYKMIAEVETGVVVTMEEGSNEPASSSSVQPIPTSSSQVAASSETVAPASSSSKQETVVDCSGKTYQAGDHNMSVNVDGKNRTFIMHVPSAYKGDKAVPLVVDYHPIGGSGEGQLNGTTYKAQTDPEGVISLYPDGTGGISIMGAGWNVGPCCSHDDDIKFSREMIKAVEEKVCIDTKRVYATGFSMGGGMSNHVACNMADVFAAVAPAAMDLNTTNSATCSPARPISIIMFRGTSDPVCRYNGGDSGMGDGLNFLGAEGNFKFWADKNGCTGSPSKNSNGCDEYSNCKDGVKVVLCTKQGGQHEYGDGKVGWSFLKSFTLP